MISEVTKCQHQYYTLKSLASAVLVLRENLSARQICEDPQYYPHELPVFEVGRHVVRGKEPEHYRVQEVHESSGFRSFGSQDVVANYV